MKAVILAGGRGKRLRPITDYVPKPLIPIKNIPIIEWQIKYLKKFGISEVIICSGYKTEMIENYLNNKKLGVKIIFSIETKPLGTGGAIKKAGKKIKDNSFLVINGDVITNIDLKKLLKKENSIAAIQLKTKFGISEVIICSGYKTEMIENYLNNKKMEEIVNDVESNEIKKKWENFDIDE